MDALEAKLERLGPEGTPDFCVEIQFPPGTRGPERIFKAVSAYIEALHALDATLVRSVDSSIRTVLLLENIESGSIKVWLKQFLEALPDEPLRKLDWRPVLGDFLVRGKYRAIKYLEGKIQLEDRKGLDALTTDLHQLAQETDLLQLPAYRSISPSDLAQGMRRISEAVSGLEGEERILFRCDDGDAAVDHTLRITPENITEILAGETIANPAERILIVRKPDFLGDTMWEFRHEKNRYMASIEDRGWLADFRAGKKDIRPGDALRVMVLETSTYDLNGEVIDEHRVISKVLGITRQQHLSLPPGK